MASSACCDAGPPIVSDYEPKGIISNVNGTDTYLIGSGPQAIVIVYDVFGFTPQAKQVCDSLAASGFNVAMPDFFKGNPWKLEHFPAPDKAAFLSWVGTSGDFDTVVRPGVESTMEFLKGKGAETFGVIGFCWGGAMAMKMAALGGGDSPIKAAACAHPAFLTEELAAEVKVPMLIMPSKDDPDHLPLKAVLDAKDFGDKCMYKRFDDMHHGFCAARGDWSVPEQAARATECVGMFVNFMKKNMES
ncbi:unnamed protein product [Discosporangium mesarthrocarpum]